MRVGGTGMVGGARDPAAEVARLPEVLVEAALDDVEGERLGGGAGVVKEAEATVRLAKLGQAGLEVRLEEGVLHALYARDGDLRGHRLLRKEVGAGGELARLAREYYKAALCQPGHLLIIVHSHTFDFGSRTFVNGHVCDFRKFYPAPAINPQKFRRLQAITRIHYYGGGLLVDSLRC